MLAVLLTRALPAPAQNPAPAARAALERVHEVAAAVEQFFLFRYDPGQALQAALAAAARAAGDPAATAAPSAARALSWPTFESRFLSLAAPRPACTDPMATAAARGFVQALPDAYTTYLTPSERRALDAEMSGGSFVGIGVEVAPHPRGLRVVAALEGSPARAAGLRPGDLIAAVDGRPLDHLGFYPAADTLLGSVGSAARLTLQSSSGSSRAVTVRRATLRMPPVAARLLTTPSVGGSAAVTSGSPAHPAPALGTSGSPASGSAAAPVSGSPAGRPAVALLRIPIFGPDTGRQAIAALDNLARQGARRVIIDLRDNPGGDLQAALALAGAIAPGRILVRVRGIGGHEQVRSAPGSPRAPPAAPPYLLLVNGGTASSSEVLAGALRDSGWARLAGTRTFGKGLIQTTVPLSGGAALKVTSAQYQTPAGHSVNHVGLTPDFPLDPDARDVVDRAARLLPPAGVGIPPRAL